MSIQFILMFAKLNYYALLLSSIFIQQTDDILIIHKWMKPVGKHDRSHFLVFVMIVIEIPFARNGTRSNK